MTTLRYLELMSIIMTIMIMTKIKTVTKIKITKTKIVKNYHHDDIAKNCLNEDDENKDGDEE